MVADTNCPTTCTRNIGAQKIGLYLWNFEPSHSFSIPRAMHPKHLN
jgi:hypothetical protein